MHGSASHVADVQNLSLLAAAGGNTRRSKLVARPAGLAANHRDQMRLEESEGGSTGESEADQHGHDEQHGLSCEAKYAHVLFHSSVKPSGESRAARSDDIKRILLSLTQPLRARICRARVRGSRRCHGYLDCWCRCTCAVVCKVRLSIQWMRSGPSQHAMLVRDISLEHRGVVCVPQGGALWNAVELRVVDAYTEGNTQITTEGLKGAFRAAKLSPRCTAPQLHSFIKLFHGKHKATSSKSNHVLVIQLQQHVDAWGVA